MGLLTALCCLALVLAAPIELINDRTPEHLTTQKTVALTTHVPTLTQNWYFRVWMFVVSADADMKQLAITKQDTTEMYAQWTALTFNTYITTVMTDSYGSAFALNKWIFMEFGCGSDGSAYGVLTLRGDATFLLTNASPLGLGPDDSITTPITANPFDVISK